MCFHSRNEYQEWLRREEEEQRRRAREAGERARLVAAVVIMRQPKTGKFEEAYKCKADDKQSIANCIRNLRAWHPGKKIVDLTHVNDVRRRLRLTEISEDKLPAPTGRVPASEDNYRDDAAAPKELVAVVFEVIPVMSRDELVTAYDEQQRLNGTKMAIEWALKHGFTPPRGEEAREEERRERVRERQTVFVSN